MLPHASLQATYLSYDSAYLSDTGLMAPSRKLLLKALTVDVENASQITDRQLRVDTLALEYVIPPTRL